MPTADQIVAAGTIILVIYTILDHGPRWWNRK